MKLSEWDLVVEKSRAPARRRVGVGAASWELPWEEGGGGGWRGGVVMRGGVRAGEALGRWRGGELGEALGGRWVGEIEAG